MRLEVSDNVFGCVIAICLCVVLCVGFSSCSDGIARSEEARHNNSPTSD